ncbi:Ribonuclease H-like superfamily [Arabidopsis thaliana x Arabidopsis arenosa]|uniref:Ribonuclease H-like superfamily n=1 Tax=Arabidopsis thaliana x Arabidopsis arenosa TaxID=1240361 RepID=A0A8T1Y7L4_9BRAS|nr:Ribonuclease H-like superfamily [Arabidopsis thaliana x Arabidopsis arenosa]
MFPDLQSLLSKALSVTTLPPTGIFMSPLAPWIMWNLWKARNYLIFEERFFSEQDLLLKAISEAREWQSAQKCLPTPAKRRHAGAATQENRAAVKCYVDAAWCGSSHMCGQGWIIYDPSSSSPTQFSDSQSFVKSALTAEALALRSALLTISRSSALSHVKVLEVYSDCKVLISTLNSKASSKELIAILLDITSLSESFDSISFNFVPRLDNVVADSLAKSALVTAKTFSSVGV